MILHILPDDKFVENFCRMAMEVAPAGLEQMFIVRDPKPYRYLPNDAAYLVNLPFDNPQFKHTLDSMGKGDRIIIHFLHPFLHNWLATTNTLASIEWVFWSSDFYTWAYRNFPDYDPETKAFLHKGQNAPLSRFRLLHWYRKLRREREKQRKQSEFNAKRDIAVSKISVFYHFIAEEYELIKSMIPLKARFCCFSYMQDISFDTMYEQVKLNPLHTPTNPAPPKLMVGNCGYPYINHLDSFEFLKGKVDGVDLIVPLSYGDKKYIAEVEARGNKMFEGHVEFLIQYWSHQEYLTLLKSCQGLMLHLNTPKAIGNVNTMLLLGKRVFLKRENIAYQYFRRLGMKLNTIDEFSIDLLMQPEDPEVVANNIRCIFSINSKQKKYDYVEQMLKLVP